MESSHPEVVAELLVHTAFMYVVGPAGLEVAHYRLWENIMAAPIDIGADDGDLPGGHLGRPVCRGTLETVCRELLSNIPAVSRCMAAYYRAEKYTFE